MVQGREEVVIGGAPAAILPIEHGTEVAPALGTGGIDPVLHTEKMHQGGEESDHFQAVTDQTEVSWHYATVHVCLLS